jgi:branched-chain amino acid aminotransferase
MLVFFNGRFVPEEKATVSIFDRGFLYGDGLYEAIRIYDGEPFLWSEHMARFYAGAEFLKITSPLDAGQILNASRELIRRNGMKEAILRVTLSRGVGIRGASPKGANKPTFAISLHPALDRKTLPRSYKLIISSFILPENDPLSIYKTANKLRQAMARDEADRAAVNEAVLLNNRGFVAEGTTTNVFWVTGKILCTPPLEAGILQGTTRGYLLRLAKALGIRSKEKNIRPDALKSVDGLFVTSCGIEIMEVSHLNGKTMKRSPLVKVLKSNYRQKEVPEAL